MKQCELLSRAQAEAKKRGLNPNEVSCPPDRQASCDGTMCLSLINLASTSSDHQNGYEAQSR